ncbi:heterokaryon incompatibility protein-domain-containing protein [Rhexocercosporidium sp. MPI-PUGE-AT-0058]|nr:heterokaryon incompatibility protein-domain-containing protein [Rhexocercosporidium sp. MPI-PUGE-AT-0058]
MDSTTSSSASLAPQIAAYDSICNSCGNFLQGDKAMVSSMVARTRAYHWPNDCTPPTAKFHSIFADMKLSAHKGCHMCNLFLASFGTKQDRKAIPDTSMILAEMYRFRDSEGQNMASVCVWPTQTNDSAAMNKFFRKFCISYLNIREKKNIMARRNSRSPTIGQESLEQIKTWLGACCKDHSTCENSWTLVSEERKLPTRLLNINKVSGQWQVHVIVGTEAQVDAAYVTLSHCWGTSDFVRLTSETYPSYSDNLPFKTLSRTFQEAVELTFALGFNYLWIDSLCIIQDSHDDWVHESSMMGSVYAQGHLNIAATYSNNGDGGLFNQSNDLSASPCVIQMTENDGKFTEAICYEDRVWHREVDATPLGKRAWVVQERVLAPRVVHFSSNQIFWECCQDRAAELLPPDSVGEDGELKKVTPYPGTNEAQDRGRMWVHTNWASLVEKYSSCSLTIQSDKLIAISGLARRVCGQLGLNPQNYLAGLWKPNLLYGLLYRVARDSAISPTRFSGRAPSWSWASLNGVITFFPHDEASLSEWKTASVLDTQTHHDGDPFGQLKGGVVRIQGPLAKLGSRLAISQTSRTIPDDESIVFTAAASEAFFDVAPESLSRQEMVLEPVYFLVLIVDSKIDEPAVVHGLLLRPIGLKRGQFERVGVLLYGQTGNFEQSLKNAKDPQRLDEALYEEVDVRKGFTIEIF